MSSDSITRENTKIVYSAREAMRHILNCPSEQHLRKLLADDIAGENKLNAIIQKIGKQRRYFISEETLPKLIDIYKRKEYKK